MQLMPATASYISRGAATAGGRARLHEPGYNLRLAQQYIGHLRNDLGSDNLFLLMAAYNGDPGNLKKWLAAIDSKNDPLLFVESLPSLETQHYVRNVTANL